MGDKKPKKNSSGKSDAHKAKVAKVEADRLAAKPADDKDKGKKK